MPYKSFFGAASSLHLRECRPSKEVPKLRPGEVPKRVLRKVPARAKGAEGSAEKVLRCHLACTISTEARTTFSVLPSAPRSGPALSEALFSALFLVGSRLSFRATGPPDPGRVSEGVSEGVSEAVSEGFLEGF